MPQNAIDVAPETLDDLVAANRILADQGILDAFGHVSIRHPGNPGHYLMSRWLAPALVAAEDIVEYDLESVALTHAGMQLYSERYIHSEIYKVRPDVHAIVHSHSPTVVPFGVTHASFRPILHNAAFLGDFVPVFDIREKFGPTDMLVNRKERGTELARVLAAHTTALMRGHGDVVVGSNISSTSCGAPTTPRSMPACWRRQSGWAAVRSCTFRPRKPCSRTPPCSVSRRVPGSCGSRRRSGVHDGLALRQGGAFAREGGMR